MIDYMELCCTPIDEDCAQVGDADYAERARVECRAFIAQLRRTFGPEPAGCSLVVKRNAHDFGLYHEVAVRFSDADEDAIDYAYKLENDLPANWDAEAIAELTAAGFPPVAERVAQEAIRLDLAAREPSESREECWREDVADASA